jgi:hypothetical protein
LKYPPRFSPGLLSLYGADDLMVQGRLLVSTRITVAPWSAKNFIVSGPTTAQQNASIFNPLKTPSRFKLSATKSLSHSPFKKGRGWLAYSAL